MAKKTTVMVTDPKDVHEGDWAEFVFESGNRFEGRVEKIEEALYVNMNPIGTRVYRGSIVWNNAFVRATGEREMPELPTEPCSVVTDVNGGIPLLVLDDRGYWCDPMTYDQYLPGDIVSFTLAKVVPAS